MSKQEIWKLTKTESRETAMREISRRLNNGVFSKCMDITFDLAIQRLEEKDKIRRDIQNKINSFLFIPEDFTWLRKD